MLKNTFSVLEIIFDVVSNSNRWSTAPVENSDGPVQGLHRDVIYKGLCQMSFLTQPGIELRHNAI